MLVDKKYVRRFSKTFIFCHWLNALSFCMLYLSGLPLYTEWFNFLYVVFGSQEVLQILHRVFAVMFISVPIIQLIFDPQSMKDWAKQILNTRLRDFKFFLYFPLELIGLHPKGMPKQGFYNVGEKVNSVVQITAWFMLVVSGIFMWFADAFPREIVVWMYPIHGIAFGLAFAAFIGHLYLSAIDNPDSLRGMTKGSVHVRYAKGHHEAWYDELIAKGEFTKEEAEQAIREDKNA